MEIIPIDKNQIDIALEADDISSELLDKFMMSEYIGMDIETTGLEYKNHKIKLIQLFSDNARPTIVRIKDDIPENIVTLIENKDIMKIFHFALFDLPFICYHWKAIPKNIVCTKIASKLINKTPGKHHSLKNLIQKHFSISIDKSQQMSNWSSTSLSKSQIEYAINDVKYLLRLYHKEMEILTKLGLDTLAKNCFKHIPTRTQLEINDFSDVYTY